MSDEIREEIRNNLIKFRKGKKISQKKLAELLKINQSAISMWETGRSSIDIINLYNICKILNISVNDLFGKYSNEQKEKSEEIRKIKEQFY
ncbi:helix-turn-helix transcriptional regulator, partial [bacterium]|nr:helix-turn-helix transcriptional regulator [bacterium]